MAQIERQKKVIDMLITAHSLLKEKYLGLASFFEIFLLIAAIILNALIFVDNHFILKITKISIDNQQVIIGVASILVFTISLVLLKVNWKEKATNHSQAAEQLFVLLQESRAIILLPDGDEKTIILKEFEKKYTLILTHLPKIPDRKFNALKLNHYRKIELSKLIDKHPGSFLWILKLKLFISSFKNA